MKRLPPMELREGEALFVLWRPGGDVEVQLRTPGRGGRVYTSRATYPPDLFRRPPNTMTADWMRAELLKEQSDAIDGQRTNRRPKKPKW